MSIFIDGGPRKYGCVTVVVFCGIPPVVSVVLKQAYQFIYLNKAFFLKIYEIHGPINHFETTFIIV